jgi:hypothetical protein
MADEHGGGLALPPVPVNALLLVLAYASMLGAFALTLMLFLPTSPVPAPQLVLPAAGAYGGVLLFWGLYLAFKERA